MYLCSAARKVSLIDRLVCKLFQAWYDLPFNPFYLRQRGIDELFRHYYRMPFLPTH